MNEKAGLFDELNNQIDHFSQYFFKQHQETLEQDFHLSSTESEIRRTTLHKLGLPVISNMEAILDTFSSRVKNEEWLLPYSFVPLPHYCSLRTTIEGLTTFPIIELSWGLNGWSLRSSIIFPECLPKVGDDYWRLFDSISRIFPWEYDNSRLVLDAHQKRFAFAFPKQPASNIYSIIRDQILITKINNPDIGSFDFGDIVVKTGTRTDSDWFAKCFDVFALLCSSNSKLAAHRDRSLDSQWKAARLKHRNL